VGSYLLETKPTARKELDALPDTVLARAVVKIDSLAHNPRPAGCAKLKGYKTQWRIRVGDWRVIYTIDDPARLVSVTHIKHRREAYEP
jgi:mRNA interferase RelE/StbE